MANNAPRRGFMLEPRDRAVHGDLYARLVRATTGLAPASNRSVTVREVYDRIFSGKVNVRADGQRGVVCTTSWMRDLVATLLQTPVPLDSFLVNRVSSPADPVEERWDVIKGKQRLTTLFAFFTGFVSVDVDGRDFVWVRQNNGPTGNLFLTSVANVDENGDRVWSGGTSALVQMWCADVRDKLRPSPGIEWASELPAEMRERFLAREILLQELPAWPREAAAYLAVWTEMKYFKQTATECVYAVPRLARLKELEHPTQRLAATFRIGNGAKEAFADAARALLCLTGSGFVPLFDATTLYDAVIGDLMRLFVSENGPELATVKAVHALRLGIDSIQEARSLIVGPNKIRATRTASPDEFACLLVTAARDQSVAQMNRVLRIFRSPVSRLSEHLSPDKLDLWKASQKSRNLAGLIRAAEP